MIHYISDLSKKMNKLICDDVLREEMGRKGREFVFINFSWNRIITRIEKVYEEALRVTIGLPKNAYF